MCEFRGPEASFPLCRDGVPLPALCRPLRPAHRLQCTPASSQRRRVLGPEKYEVITGPPLKSPPEIRVPIPRILLRDISRKKFIARCEEFLAGSDLLFFFLLVKQ